MEFSVSLTYQKSTKGTHVYSNKDKGFPGIYIPKELMGNSQPEVITVTFRSLSNPAEE